MLQSDDFSVRQLIRKMNVEVICTTDDPVDSLEHHQKIREDGFETRVLPAWRPDKAMAVEDPASTTSTWMPLEEASDSSISTYMDLLTAFRTVMISSMRWVAGFPTTDWRPFMPKIFDHQEIERIFLKGKIGTSSESAGDAAFQIGHAHRTGCDGS